MSEHDHESGRDPLAELAAQLPWDRPDDARREAVRSALLAAARDEGQPRVAVRRGWVGVGIGLAGVLAAAAAVAIVVGRGGSGGGGGGGGGASDVARPLAAVEVVGGSAGGEVASYDRHLERTATGSDEVIRVRAGTLHLIPGALAAGDHLRAQSGDVQVEVDGQGDVEVGVVADAMEHVTVRSGTARVVVSGQQPVFLAAGQTWHAATITATIDLPAPAGTPSGHAGFAAPAPAAPVPQLQSVPQPQTVPQLQPQPQPQPQPSRQPQPLPLPQPQPQRQPSRQPQPQPLPQPQPQPQPRPQPLPLPQPQIATRVTPTPTPTPGSGPATPAPAITSQLTPPPPVLARSAIEQHFQRGTELLRTGHAVEAAVELGLAADASTSDALAVDARYFQAVALLKANRAAEAEHAVLAFLDHAPSSPRRGRASVMLARLLATHDQGSARAWFQAALSDADPTVAAAARAGLDALGH